MEPEEYILDLVIDMPEEIDMILLETPEHQQFATPYIIEVLVRKLRKQLIISDSISNRLALSVTAELV